MIIISSNNTIPTSSLIIFPLPLQINTLKKTLTAMITLKKIVTDNFGDFLFIPILLNWF